MTIFGYPIEIASIIVTISIAFIGYFVTYINNLRINRRNERLTLINSQINELYGPMYVITQTGQILFDALSQKMRFLGGTYINEDAPKGKDDISEWRLWVENVFVPQNEELAQIILEKAHLIIEEEMPACLKLFYLHHAGYKVVVEKWARDDFSESTSLIPYPLEIVTYAKESYTKLKKKQLNIIRQRY